MRAAARPAAGGTSRIREGGPPASAKWGSPSRCSRRSACLKAPEKASDKASISARQQHPLSGRRWQVRRYVRSKSVLTSGLGCSAAIPLAPRVRYRHRSLSTSIVYGRVGLLRRCRRIERRVLIEMETRREKLEPLKPFAHRITRDKMLRLHWEGRSDDLRLSNRFVGEGSYLHLPSAAIGPQHPRRIK